MECESRFEPFESSIDFELDGFGGFGGAGLDASVNFGLGTSFGATTTSAIGGGVEGAEDEIDFLLTGVE